MTEEEKLALLKQLVSETDETVLTAYLNVAADGILRKAYPFDATVTAVPDRYARLQCEIAAYLLNKRGAEGQLLHSENGVSRSYESAHIPSSMLRGVTAFCKVVG